MWRELFKSLSIRLLECERLSTQLDFKDMQKLQLTQQHYHELIEAKRKHALALVNLLLSSFDFGVAEEIKDYLT